MSFIVEQIKDAGTLQLCATSACSSSSLVRVYPVEHGEEDEDELVITNLRLVHREEEAAEKGLWTALRSLFTHSTPHYRIVLHQVSPTADEGSKLEHAFILYESEEDASEAYHQLDTLLRPLVDDGQVTLTKPLLKEILLPKPVKVDNLAHFLVGVVDKHPGAHKEWNKIFNTLLITACSHDSVDDIDLLTSRGATLEQTCRRSGKTPIHVAVSSNATSVLDHMFLAMQPLTDMIVDTSSTRRPHKLVHRQSYGRLRDNIDIYDASGNTPLMLAVEMGSVASSLYLLLGGARPSSNHKHTRDTPLHVAARSGHTTLVKLLVAFDADLSVVNTAGQTPLDVAKNKGITAILNDAARVRKISQQLYSEALPFKSPACKTSSKYLLSYDGGGVRNITSVQILLAIEARMRQLQPDCSPLTHYFQYLAGTSSGAIGVLLFAYKNTSLTTCRSLVFRSITEIFAKSTAPLREKHMIAFLMDIYGEDTQMSHTVDPKVIVTTTLADRNPPKLYLMRNYCTPPEIQIGLHKDVNFSPEELRVWEAANASAAAPLFFPPFRECFLDGGLMANNPTLDGMVEVFRHGKENGDQRPSLGCVLSLGSGKARAKPVSNIAVFFDKNFKTLFDLPNTLRSAQSLLELFISQVTQSDGQEVRRARAWCESLNVPYYRFSPLLSADVSPGETSIPVLVDLLYDTHQYIHENAQDVDDAARTILCGNPSEPVHRTTSVPSSVPQ